MIAGATRRVGREDSRLARHAIRPRRARATIIVLALAASCLVSAIHAEASALIARAVGTWRAGSAVIVGRARCAGRIFVLTDTPDLALVDVSSGRTLVRQVTGLQPRDAPWGLACTSGSELWSLASPHALVRLATDGRVAERLPLTLPRFALFSGPDRLLFQQLPIAAGEAALHAAEPRKPNGEAQWSGLVARASTSRGPQLAANLALCGLSGGTEVPCWFADDTRIVISNGGASRSIEVAAARGAGVDRAAPIHDVALAGPQSLWVLTTRLTPEDGRLVGGRLALLDGHGAERAHLDLTPPARLIVAAGRASCHLLTVRGELLELTER